MIEKIYFACQHSLLSVQVQPNGEDGSTQEGKPTSDSARL